MDWLQDAWHFVVTSTPNWDLILRFLDVLIWPFVVLFAVISIRPGRLIDSLLENGGEISAGGTAIRLGKRIDEVAASVQSNAEIGVATEPRENPLEESADPYTTIMNGWGLVVQGLEDAAARTGGGRLDGRNPMATVRRLREEDWIGKKLANSIQELWDVRNQITRAGSNKLRRLGINARTADQYYQSAARLQVGIGRAISYRERKAATQTPLPDFGGSPETRPN